jgi:hypothetical protein
MGARDGEQAIPPRWLEPIVDVDRIKLVAERLVGSGSPDQKDFMDCTEPA